MVFSIYIILYFTIKSVFYYVMIHNSAGGPHWKKGLIFNNEPFQGKHSLKGSQVKIGN